MIINAYRTPKIVPGNTLIDIIINALPTIDNNSILVITSKIISICQNRIIPKNQVDDKYELVKNEADFYLDGDYTHEYGICLTIKHGILIPTAGIDESNSNDCYVLYPYDLQNELTTLWTILKNHYHIENLGILVTDSHTTPLRRGVTGIALGWCGFKPLHNYIGEPDIFGNLLRVTQLNLVDNLACAAVLMMGEGNEQTPLALIQNMNDKIVFQNHPPTVDELNSVSILIEHDIYAPLLKNSNWKSKQGKKL
jgi:putative folate metabolism gamma-glutamate ligase